MATDNDRQATKVIEFQKKLDAMVATVDDVKKRYDAACAHVLATTMLLEEEKHMTAILAEEARVVAALIEPPSPTPPLTPPIVMLHRAMTMRLPSSPTSMSRPPTCRTSVFSSQSRWTSPPRTMPGGMTTSCSPLGVTLSLITC
jgi:hypothetical protein